MYDLCDERKSRTAREFYQNTHSQHAARHLLARGAAIASTRYRINTQLSVVNFIDIQTQGDRSNLSFRSQLFPLPPHNCLRHGSTFVFPFCYYMCSVQSGNLAQSADCTVAVQSADCMPCSLQTARGPFMHVCALER